jgi:hypothetical protein
VPHEVIVQLETRYGGPAYSRWGRDRLVDMA